MKMTATPSSERRAYVVLGFLSLAAVVSTGILSLSYGTFFEPYFGRVPPLPSIALVVLVNVASLSILQSHGWFEIYTRESIRGIVFSVVAATLFAIWPVFVEFLQIVQFPRNINVPFPQSLLFYPIMGYVAEACLHALPLALLLMVLTPLLRKVSINVIVWPCIIIVSCLEPIIQMRLGFSPSVGLFVFAFNLFQLLVFRRYDFVSMYSLRLAYYMYWHVLWGYLRLKWLF